MVAVVWYVVLWHGVLCVAVKCCGLVWYGVYTRDVLCCAVLYCGVLRCVIPNASGEQTEQGIGKLLNTAHVDWTPDTSRLFCWYLYAYRCTQLTSGRHPGIAPVAWL